jgi:hypothetical protein
MNNILHSSMRMDESMMRWREDSEATGSNE